MKSLPSISEVIDALNFAVLPSFAASLVCGIVLPRILGRRVAYVSASLAIIAGMMAGNYFRDVFTFRSDPEVPLSVTTLTKQFVAALNPPPVKTTEDTANEPRIGPPRGRYWLPWMALFATVVGSVYSLARVPEVIRVALRLLTSVIAVGLLIPENVSLGALRLWIYFAAVVFGSWTILERSAREPTKTSATFGIAFVCMATAALLLHAHSARLSDGATILGAGLLGVAIAGRFGRADVAGAAPAISILLPGFLLYGWFGTFSKIPPIAFALPALSPLMLMLMLPFSPSKFGGWKRTTAIIVLLLIPAVIAVAKAAKAEPLNFDEGI